MLDVAEVFTRPNGKLYRPQQPPSVQTYQDQDDYECVVVLRTHDIASAVELAAEQIDYLGIDAANAVTDWWRAVPFDRRGMYDWSWITDTVRGVPCVVIPYD